MTLPTECCKKTRASRVKVEENGKRAVFTNGGRVQHTKIRVDGCVLKNTVAADYVVHRPDVGHVIVELKGRDVDHAVKQVEATANHWVKNGYCQSKIAALIVARQHPRITTSIQKAKHRFAQTYGTPIHVVTKNFEGDLKSIFDFKGPF